MRLLGKLILTFTVLAFLPLLLMAGMLLATQRAQLMDAGREHVRCLAGGLGQRVDFLLERTIEQVEQLAASHYLAQGLAAAGRAYDRLQEEAIREMLLARDGVWTAGAGHAQAELVRQCLDSAAATALKSFQRVAPDRYAEIILTDRAGALYAATNVTTDYYQADEEWWQRAYAGGRGATFIGRIGFDQSAAAFTLDVALPVRDESGNVVGVLKVCHAVNALFDLIRDLRVGETGGADLVDAQGRAVFTGGDRSQPVRFDQPTIQEMRSLAQGVFVRQLTGREDQHVVGFARLASTQEGGRAPVPGGPWFALISQSAAEVYAPSRRALFWSLLILALPVAGLILLAVYLDKRLVEPIRALHWASE